MLQRGSPRRSILQVCVAFYTCAAVLYHPSEMPACGAKAGYAVSSSLELPLQAVRLAIPNFMAAVLRITLLPQGMFTGMHVWHAGGLLDVDADIVQGFSCAFGGHGSALPFSYQAAVNRSHKLLQLDIQVDRDEV